MTPNMGLMNVGLLPTNTELGKCWETAELTHGPGVVFLYRSTLWTTQGLTWSSAALAKLVIERGPEEIDCWHKSSLKRGVHEQHMMNSNWFEMCTAAYKCVANLEQTCALQQHQRICMRCKRTYRQQTGNWKEQGTPCSWIDTGSALDSFAGIA
jgi:hypothetical protein